jgi:hypothetical protein
MVLVLVKNFKEGRGQQKQMVITILLVPNPDAYGVKE